MSAEPIVCTIDPAQAPAQEKDLRAVLSAAERIERPTPQHLRLTLAVEGGLDIGPLAREKQCCRFFDFTLTPTTEGTVVLDVRVPADRDPAGTAGAESDDSTGAEQLLDEFAMWAAETGTSTKGGGRDDRCGAAHECAC